MLSGYSLDWRRIFGLFYTTLKGAYTKKMREKYVQLPLLPLDLPLESIELIWLYARMSQEEKQMFQDFMRDTLKDSPKDIHQTEPLKTIKTPDEEISSDVAEFTSLMREMIGTLIVQACEMAAIVYQHHCINKKSVEEISKAINVPEETVQLIAQHYDRKNK